MVEGRNKEKSYYGVCAIGGMLSSGATHVALTPLDVLKVNMQVPFFSLFFLYFFVFAILFIYGFAM